MISPYYYTAFLPREFDFVGTIYSAETSPGDRADLCWGSSDNYRAVELEGNQGRRWNEPNSSRDELEGYMVIQEASVVHSSVELEINQLIPG